MEAAEPPPPSDAPGPQPGWIRTLLAQRDWGTSTDPSVKRGQYLGFYAEVVGCAAARGGLRDWEVDELQGISCSVMADSLWYCFNPFHQFPHYYRTSQHDECTLQFTELTTCMKLKTMDVDRARGVLERTYGSSLTALRTAAEDAEAYGESARMVKGLRELARQRERPRDEMPWTLRDPAAARSGGS